MIEGGRYNADIIYYLQELARREESRKTTTMVWLTAIIGVLTVVNVIAVIINAS